MTFSKLEKNIIDVIKEEQVKLGYRRETDDGYSKYYFKTWCDH